MLHDQVMSDSFRSAAIGLSTDDRRHGDRLPFPAEVILLWHHDSTARHRYQILDASDGGYRIRTALPIAEGTTGTVVRVLACSITCAAQPVMVAWCCESPTGDGYELGLRRF